MSCDKDLPLISLSEKVTVCTQYTQCTTNCRKKRKEQMHKYLLLCANREDLEMESIEVLILETLTLQEGR